MRFLADMGLGMAVVAWLRSEGHDAVHLRELELHRLSDRDIFAKAIEEERIVLTFDLDFSEIAALNPGKSASVVVFRLGNARVANVIARLKAVLRDSSKSLESGAIVTVEEFRHRVRQLPIHE